MEAEEEKEEDVMKEIKIERRKRIGEKKGHGKVGNEKMVEMK